VGASERADAMSWSLDDWSLVDWALDESECAGLLPAVVGIDLGISDPDDFIVGVSLVDGPKLIGDGFTTVNSAVNRVSIRRGRTGRLIDPIDAASVNIVLNNEDRSFDPAFASGPFYEKLVPSREVAVSVGGVRIFTGYVEDYDLDYDVSGRSTAAVRCTDALGILGQCSFTSWTNAATTGAAKLSNICNRSEVDWPAELRSFDQGIDRTIATTRVKLQGDNVSWGSNVLNYCQLIARSEYFSLFFATARGVLRYQQFIELDTTTTFKDDYEWLFPRYEPVSVAFGGAGVPFTSIRRTTGSETLFSSVSVDRENGIAQTATVPNTTVWKNIYGRLRRLTIPETLLATDTDSETVAVRLLAFYYEPSDDINELTVELGGLSCADQVLVLGIDIGDTVSVEFTPNDIAPAITQTLAVQGISHDISPASHTVTFSLFNYLDATLQGDD
jgi:hypothetical protein